MGLSSMRRFPQIRCEILSVVLSVNEWITCSPIEIREMILFSKVPADLLIVLIIDIGDDRLFEKLVDWLIEVIPILCLMYSDEGMLK